MIPDRQPAPSASRPRGRSDQVIEILPIETLDRQWLPEGALEEPPLRLEKSAAIGHPERSLPRSWPPPEIASREMLYEVTIAPHRQARDEPAPSVGPDTVTGFDPGQDVLAKAVSQGPWASGSRTRSCPRRAWRWRSAGSRRPRWRHRRYPASGRASANHARSRRDHGADGGSADPHEACPAGV